MRPLVRTAAAAALLLLSSACANVIGADKLEKVDCLDCAVDPGSSSADASIPPGSTVTNDAGADAAARDGAADAVADTGSPADAAADTKDAALAPCPGTSGPVGVRVGSFCIDATEVTNRHYAAFVAAKNGDMSGQPSVCSFNSSYVPSLDWPASTSKLDSPVVYVDWCDARAYCAWAGKRLCGAVGGGSSTFGSVGNPTTNQWFAACSAGGTKTFAYGNGYKVGACNDYELKLHATLPVGSLSTCVGGMPGISDMNGNVWEWEDGCETSSGGNDSCLIRGGSFNFAGATYSTCSGYFNDYKVHRSDNFDDTGIRCCSP